MEKERKKNQTEKMKRKRRRKKRKRKTEGKNTKQKIASKVKNNITSPTTNILPPLKGEKPGKDSLVINCVQDTANLTLPACNIKRYILNG